MDMLNLHLENAEETGDMHLDHSVDLFSIAVVLVDILWILWGFEMFNVGKTHPKVNNIVQFL